jgi:NADPH-dependent 2,4-dienoyl-CoA reductase/sulfur reductase-like enzyme/rhodanese-related sulfurtransferase
MATKIIVIGGSAAGPKAAAKARRIMQDAEITIIQKGRYLSMASCGYPYYVGGVFEDKTKLISSPTGTPRDSAFFRKTKDINAVVNTEVIEIDRNNKVIKARNLKTNELSSYNYDKLVIATGASPIFPAIEGKGLNNIRTLQSMDDADELRKLAKSGTIKSAVIVGGGLIGIETCEALQLAGIKVTVVEKQKQILPFLDCEMAALVASEVRKNNTEIITGVSVVAFNGSDVVESVSLSDGRKLECDLVVIAIGVSPNISLAKESGLRIGTTGAIWVNKFLQTSDPDIYAAGDCIEITDLVTSTKIKTHWPMGDAANLQGRIVGQNITRGNSASYEGAVLTGICKVFNYSVGSAGISERRARAEGYSNIITSIHFALDKPGFMGGEPIGIKLVADKRTGVLLGAQIIGSGDVSKRLAIASMALHNKMHIHEMVNLDLPYAPPFSPAIDNFITAIHVLENKLLGYVNGITAIELKERLDKGDEIYILDVRDTNEYNHSRLGIGEILLPLGSLRKHADMLPKDKTKEIITFCQISLRGYEAARFLSSLGYEDVKILEGGIMAWPYKKEK